MKGWTTPAGKSKSVSWLQAVCKLSAKQASPRRSRRTNRRRRGRAMTKGWVKNWPNLGLFWTKSGTGKLERSVEKLRTSAQLNENAEWNKPRAAGLSARETPGRRWSPTHAITKTDGKERKLPRPGLRLPLPLLDYSLTWPRSWMKVRHPQ